MAKDFCESDFQSYLVALSADLCDLNPFLYLIYQNFDQNMGLSENLLSVILKESHKGLYFFFHSY